MTGAAESERYRRGWTKLTEVDGEAGVRVVQSLQDISPELGRFVVEFAFGDVISRPGLGLRERVIATIAALTALGSARAQLAARRARSSRRSCRWRCMQACRRH